MNYRRSTFFKEYRSLKPIDAPPFSRNIDLLNLFSFFSGLQTWVTNLRGSSIFPGIFTFFQVTSLPFSKENLCMKTPLVYSSRCSTFLQIYKFIEAPPFSCNIDLWNLYFFWSIDVYRNQLFKKHETTIFFWAMGAGWGGEGGRRRRRRRGGCIALWKVCSFLWGFSCV